LFWIFNGFCYKYFINNFCPYKFGPLYYTYIIHWLTKFHIFVHFNFFNLNFIKVKITKFSVFFNLFRLHFLNWQFFIENFSSNELSHSNTSLLTACDQNRAQAYEKKQRLYFLFILVRTPTTSIQFISKQVFLFWFFLCCCFAFISKAATTKNRHFIYDLSMLSLDLGSE
jgi:hypothetical protein